MVDTSRSAALEGLVAIRVVECETGVTGPFSATVESVGERSQDGWIRVETSSVDAVVLVRLPLGGALPIRPEDRIRVHVTSEVQGIHVIAHGLVTTDDGALLIAFSEDADPRFAPGWQVEVLVGANGSGIGFRCGDAGAISSRYDWRIVDTPLGTYAVSGTAMVLSPLEPLVPDARSTRWFGILRASVPSVDDACDPFAPAPKRFLEAPVSWHTTWSVFVPFQANVGEDVWVLRLNEFPEEPLYTLFIEGRAIGSLDDWPTAWNKPGPLEGLLRRKLVKWAREIAERARES